MIPDPTSNSELAPQLILEMGSRDAIDIARRNCWRGIVTQVLSFERGLQPQKTSVRQMAEPRRRVRS